MIEHGEPDYSYFSEIAVVEPLLLLAILRAHNAWNSWFGRLH